MIDFGSLEYLEKNELLCPSQKCGQTPPEGEIQDGHRSPGQKGDYGINLEPFDIETCLMGH